MPTTECEMPGRRFGNTCMEEKTPIRFSGNPKDSQRGNRADSAEIPNMEPKLHSQLLGRAKCAT